MIHNEILKTVETALNAALITDVGSSDVAAAGIVKLGSLQGEPDPDTARISITLHENDPDRFIPGAVTGLKDDWSDEVEFVEIGGATTWKRRFTIKARCLLDATKEGLSDTREIASTLRSRIEHALPGISFDAVRYDNEYVARGIVSETLKGEMVQSGGPPDSYDYFIKFRFDVLTTRNDSGVGG
jgi:hypothetical protein